MSDEDKQSVPEEGQNDESNDGTVTAEQFHELKEKYEQILKAQSGSDKKVKELMDELRKEREEKEKSKKTAEQRLAELEQKWQEADRAREIAELKGYANELLSSEGLKTKFIDKLLGSNREETEANVRDFIEEQNNLKAQIADEFARKHGRKVQESSQDGESLSKEQIAERMRSDPGWYNANRDYVEKRLKELAGG